MTDPLVLGIDLGTSGVRALAATADGTVVALATANIDATIPATARGNEQQPDIWWQNVRNCLNQLGVALRGSGYALEQIRGLAVDGTSGTLVVVDDAGVAIRPALMYSDGRATAEAADLNNRAQAWCTAAGYRIEPSFAIAKIAWLEHHEPAVFAQASRFVHQADYIVGRLTGNFAVTDYSNALKTGYDLVHERWPDWLAQLPDIAQRLPAVVAPGSVVGEVSAEAGAAIGLPAGLPVVAGATDGVAAAVAAGVRRPGDYNTTLGTTLVFKGVSSRPTIDPQGLIYAHKLPGGRWLPGAASNCGAGWIRAWFPDRLPEELDHAARALIPSRLIAYPLVGRGERFPFRSAIAEQFCQPAAATEAEAFAAYLTGTALVERAAYETLDRVCQTSGGAVYSTEGGSKSDLWMQCRADVTRRMISRPRVAESAFGSAILAAAGTIFSSLDEAIVAMSHQARSFEPSSGMSAYYDELYGRFQNELRQRGYLTNR